MQQSGRLAAQSAAGTAGPSARCPAPVQSRRGPPRLVARSDRRDGDPELSELKDKFFRAGDQARQRSQPASSSGSDPSSLLDSVNPYQLGRQARQAVNTLWDQLSAVAAPTRSFSFDDVLDPGLDADAPSSARNTRVLVLGATGRVGRIITRKLLLRGYKVRALVRRRDGLRADLEGVPDAVEVLRGDVGEMTDVQRAVRGVDKVRGRALGAWPFRSLAASTQPGRGAAPGMSRGGARVRGCGAPRAVGGRWRTQRARPRPHPRAGPRADHLCGGRAHRVHGRPAARGRPRRHEPGQGVAGAGRMAPPMRPRMAPRMRLRMALCMPLHAAAWCCTWWRSTPTAGRGRACTPAKPHGSHAPRDARPDRRPRRAPCPPGRARARGQVARRGARQQR